MHDTQHTRPARSSGTRRRLQALWTDAFGRLATRSAQAILVLLLVAAIVRAALALKLVVIPLLLALIFCAALFPLVALLRRCRVPHALAALVTLLLGGVGVGGMIALAVARVASQWETLQASAIDGFGQALHYLHRGPLSISEQQIDHARDAMVGFLTSSEFGQHAMAGVFTTLELATGFVLVLFILFFFLKDGPSIWRFLIGPLRPAWHARVTHAGDRAIGVLGGYLRGTALVALVDTVFIGGTVWILGVPMAVPLSILVLLGAFVPIVGATVTGVIAALVALVTVGLNAAIWVSAVVIVVNQLEGNLLSPVVLGRSLHLHSLAVLLALTAGTILGGIVGTLLAVPITGVAWAVAKSWNDPLPVSPDLQE
ncbi:AI-2E family transporter [Frateuria hangzhouensis]|uniref:AI-2E family transporter n=1 Tax=Frateuria hangzhouensis TaxID=2995589 RepID=UPI002260A9AF|nr:AI-2E family transporter [Frateuria sp. STR12]MCX7512210.1 AI-2E family transporter [Frateuria sp. STR12]